MNFVRGGLVAAATVGMLGVVAMPAEAEPVVRPVVRPAKPGDVNGDGRADVIAGLPFFKAKKKTDAGGVAVFLGGRTKVGKARVATVGKPRARENLGRTLVTGDFNRDGYADVLATARHRIVAFYGSRTGLRAPQGFAWPVGFPAIAAGDFNRDGYTDVAVRGKGQVVILKGGKKKLRLGQRIRGESGFGSLLAAGDFNGDGAADLVATVKPVSPTDPVTDQKLLHFNGSKRGLVNRGEIKLPGEQITRHLTLGDVDFDGRADLVRITSRGENVFQVAVHSPLTGAPTWLPANPDVYPSNVAVGNHGMIAVHVASEFGDHDWVEVYRSGTLLRRLAHRDYETRYGESLRFANVKGDSKIELIVGLPGVYGVGELELLPNAELQGVQRVKPSPANSAGLGVSQPS